MRSERAALLISAGAALAIGGVGIVTALATGSGAILLDGLFNLCFFVTALFTLRVAVLVARPDDARYPFGYGYFEPLINTVKGLLILGVSIFALIDAASALAAGGREVAFGPALVYAAVVGLACAGVTLLLRRTQRTVRSPLVAADIDNWRVNALITAGVFAGFLAAAALQRSGHATAARLADPAMVALVVLVSLAVPIRMAFTGLGALLNRAPPPAVVAGVEELARAALGDLPVRRLWVRVSRPGRTANVLVHVLLPEATPLDVAEADRLRGRIIAALVAHHAPVIVDVVFTAVEAYAAPTAGYT